MHQPTPTPTPADASPLAVVQAQLDAYNARDIDAFARTFSDDIEAYDLVAPASSPHSTSAGSPQQASSSDVNTLRFRGIAALRERYGTQFREHPLQRSNVVTRCVLGELVFDLEHITGMQGREPFHLMAIYRVREGRIDRCWFSPRV